MQLIANLNTTWVESLIELEADCNVLSYKTWVELGKPNATPSSLTFTSFLGITFPCLGQIYLNARIKNQPMGIIFHIAHINQDAMNIVLG